MPGCVNLWTELQICERRGAQLRQQFIPLAGKWVNPSPPPSFIVKMGKRDLIGIYNAGFNGVLRGVKAPDRCMLTEQLKSAVPLPSQ